MDILEKVTHNDEQNEGIEYQGVFYPYDIEALKRDADAMRLPVWGQIEYLENAMVAYSIERKDLIDPLKSYIGELHQSFDKIASTFATTDEISNRCGIRLDAYRYDSNYTTNGVNLGFFRGQSTVGNRDLKNINIAMTGRAGESFVTADDVEEGDVRSLQNKLVENHLMAIDEKCPYKDPLLVAFGTRNNIKKVPYRMMWLGKNNQLSYMISTLYNNRVIRCGKDRKWAVAAQLFVKGTERKPFTGKQLANAVKINIDDENEVKRCIPKKMLSYAE